MNTLVAVAVGRRLREARKASGLTQLSVAAAVGAQRQSVSAWERGRYLPTTPQLYVLCLVLGVSADLVLYGMETIPVGGGMLDRVFRDRRLDEVDQPFRY